VPLFVPGYVLGRDRGVSPSEKINTVSIGLGNRGGESIGGFLNNPTYQVRGICDVFAERTVRGKNRVDDKYNTKDCLTFERYEDVLERDDIDAVVIATPDHWHTKISIDACKAGKDVYCEKPLTLTLAESRQIVTAARRYNRVCTSGSQRVMEDYGYMAPVIQSGAIGEVKEVIVQVGGPPTTGNLPAQPVPAGLNWDRWLGQAPWREYNGERMSGSYGGGWRRYEDYGNGFLADWGAHKFGGVLYALGLDDVKPVKILPPGVDGEFLTMILKNGIKVRHASRGDITFVGTERTYNHGDRSIKPLKTVDVRRYSGRAGNICDDFAYCVRNRIRPFQDFLYGATTAAACQMIHICYKLNRPLEWDEEKYEFVGDEQASRMIFRPQRSPYTISDV
jgi:predicted dehydrogenase